MGKPAFSTLKQELRWSVRSWQRQLLGARAEPEEWQALAAYQGAAQQAWHQHRFQPEIISHLWVKGHFQEPQGFPAFFSPSKREREPSSHHYGHDIQLKRFAGLPLIGRPLPFLLEHGLKVSKEAQFETPRDWSKGGYLCMGEQRAQWLRDQHQCPATAIGPWINYAKPLLSSEQIGHIRQRMGPTLLVILAHSWDRMQRRMNIEGCVAAIQELIARHGYNQVIWLRHWQDPTGLPIPKEWHTACNGHRSNPWFLDSLRTLLEICDGVTSNAFGTHIGYAAAFGKNLHWIHSDIQEDYSRLSHEQASRAHKETLERNKISMELANALQTGGHSSQTNSALLTLLEPFWGLRKTMQADALRGLLQGNNRPSAHNQEPCNPSIPSPYVKNF